MESQSGGYGALRLGIILAAGLVLLWVAKGSRFSDGTGRMAPGFELEDLHGDKVRLSDFKGKVVLLAFGGPGCEACEQSAPMINELHERYAGQGLVVLGVVGTGLSPTAHPWVRDATFRDASEYAVRFHIPHKMLVDLENRVGASYSVHGIPTLVLIGRDGRIVMPRGYPWPIDAVEQRIVTALKAAANQG